MALTISFLLGPVLIRRLTANHIGQPIRTDGPARHQVKAGTPTMGGTLILFSLVLSTLLLADLTNPYVWLVLLRDARLRARSASSTTTASTGTATRRACGRARSSSPSAGSRRSRASC